MLRVLRHRSVRNLWSGQLLSAIGDELFEVALIWYAASMMGNAAGYLLAFQAAAIFLVSLFGGIWSDSWDDFRTMIAVDLVRALAVGSLAVAGLQGQLTLVHVIVVTVVVASCKAFFEPALKSALPSLISSRSELQKTAAMMGTTHRFARILGPGLAGILGKIIPVLHYFSIDALSFLISAWSIRKVARKIPNRQTASGPRGWAGVKEGLLGGMRLVQKTRFMTFMIGSGALVNAAWFFTFPMAFGLIIYERYPTDVSAFSLVVGAYGIGNLASNVLLGFCEMKRFDLWLYSARILAAVGFILFALAPSFSWMLVAAAFSAIAGPIADLAVVNSIQFTYSAKQIVKVHRFSMMLSYAYLLMGLLVSPIFFKLYSVSNCIVALSLSIGAFGILGLVAFRDVPEK